MLIHIPESFMIIHFREICATANRTLPYSLPSFMFHGRQYCTRQIPSNYQNCPLIRTQLVSHVSKRKEFQFHCHEITFLVSLMLTEQTVHSQPYFLSILQLKCVQWILTVCFYSKYGQRCPLWFSSRATKSSNQVLHPGLKYGNGKGLK